MTQGSGGRKSNDVLFGTIAMVLCIAGLLGAIWLIGQTRDDVTPNQATLFEMLGFKKKSP